MPELASCRAEIPPTVRTGEVAGLYVYVDAGHWQRAPIKSHPFVYPSDSSMLFDDRLWVSAGGLINDDLPVSAYLRLV